MGRVANAVAKFLIKQYLDEYTWEQKDVICSAIDKHGTGVFRHFISSNNDYKLSANEMREVLKHIDVVTANSSNFLHLSSLPKTSLLYFARVSNEITETKTGPVPFSVALKNNAKFSYTSYEECLLKTYYEVACHIQKRLSFLGRPNEEILASLEFAKEKLINPYLKDGYEGDIFQRTALTQIQYACREKVDVLRLLNCKYTSEKIIFLTNAMLNGVDKGTLDRMCAPALTFAEMYEIEHGKTVQVVPSESQNQNYGFNFSREQYKFLVDVLNDESKLSKTLAFICADGEFFDSPRFTVSAKFHNQGDLKVYFPLYLKINNNVLKDTGYCIESFDAKTIPNTYEEFCKRVDESFKNYAHLRGIFLELGNEYLDECTKRSMCSHKELKPEKIPSVDSLISRATAISEQSKGLADDLGKLKDDYVME